LAAFPSAAGFASALSPPSTGGYSPSFFGSGLGGFYDFSIDLVALASAFLLSAAASASNGVAGSSFGSGAGSA